MHVHHHHMRFRRGRQFFGVRRLTDEGQVRFAGYLNGVECGVWPTKEAAVQALLRRAAQGALQQVETVICFLTMVPPFQIRSS